MSTVQNYIENRDISEFSLPGYSEIPNVGLYLKQVVKYINETLNPWFDLKVTDTMISNYVKMHLVPNAVKKLYYRDQIAAFLFIVLAKPVVSLDNIQTLLEMRKQRYEPKEAYELFGNAFGRILKSVFGGEGEKVPEEEDIFQELMRNIIIAIVQKYYIEKCFRDLEKYQAEAKSDEAL